MKASTIAILFAAIPALAFAETPDRFVRYVESTGSQYVDTGVTGRWNTKIEAQVEWMNLADSGFVSAGSNSNNTRLYMCYTYKHGSESSENVMYTCAEGKLDEIFYNGSAARWEKNRIYDYVAELSATNSAGETTNKIAVDGLQIWNKSSAGLDTGRTLYIFANNKESGTVNAKSKTRCYRLKIWQGPIDGGDMTLVRDLIPCLKDGRAGLYDAVSGDILYSGSGTDLVAAGENSETPDAFVEYVESTGVNFIDTEIEARSGTEAEIEVATLHKRTLRKGLLGAITSENVYFDLFHSYEASVACSYGTRLTTGGTYANGERYYFRSSLAAGAQTLAKANYDATAATNTVYEGTDETAIDTGLSLYLFGRNSNGNVADGGIYRLYGLKIKQDGVLMRDFKPCLKDGEFALYDDVSKRIFHAKRGLLNGPLQATPVKAKNLIFVDYIESDGTQTLDTGVRARYGTRAKGDFAWAAALRTKTNEENTYLEAPIYRNGRCYLGADDPTYWPNFFFMMYAENQKVWGGYGNGLGNNSVTYGASTSVSMTTAGTKYSFDASFMDGEQKVELDSTQIWSLSNSAAYDTGRNIHIFSSGSRYRSAARCYGLEIWQDGEKVRDFKPCIYDNKAALYDTVTQCVYLPSPYIPVSKTGSIVLSGEEKPAYYVDYVESDGTIFVDTGITGKSGTKGEFKMQFKEKGDLGFLETWNSSASTSPYDMRRFYLWHNYLSQNVFCIGYGKFQSFSSSRAINTDYTVSSSLCTGALSVTVNGTTWTQSDFTAVDASATIDSGLNLHLFAQNKDGSPASAGKARLYYLKLYQGNADGSNMQLVRNFKPVQLSNGLVALWDFKNKKTYLPQLVSSPGTYTQFPVVGSTGDKINAGTVILIR
jgi:hypothetical protein